MRKHIWLFIPIIVVALILSSCYRPLHSEDYYEGYDEGYEDGANDWSVLDEKFESGIEIGREEGYEYGFSDGYSEGHDAGYEEGRDYGYELGREDFDRIEWVVDEAVSHAKTYSEWHPEEALLIIDCYVNNEAFWEDGSPPTHAEYLDAIDSLYGFYEYFYNGWYD